jgi:hypothetical protein
MITYTKDLFYEIMNFKDNSHAKIPRKSFQAEIKFTRKKNLKKFEILSRKFYFLLII